tara:strand:- start:12305 stop:12790 length:486 start_codon:yes stop_codon:yes gene_type:complete
VSDFLGLLKFPQTILNDFQRNEFLQQFRALDVSAANPFTVTMKLGKEKRSDAMNRLSHMWYSDCAKQGAEFDAGGIKSIAKHKWGVPIMREDESFNATWLKLIIGFPTYEEIMDFMPLLPVTSLMDNAQMSRYMNDFNRVMGVKYELTDPRMVGLNRELKH